MKRANALVGLLLALSAVLATAGPGRTQGDNDVLRPARCPITQLELSQCPNLVTASFSDGRHQWTLTLGGPIALYEKLERYAQQPKKIYIVDHDTLDQPRPTLINAEKAWYLYDAEGSEDVCQAPFVYAFKTREAALEARKSLGGELMDWPTASKQLKQDAADWDRHARHKVDLQGRNH